MRLTDELQAERETFRAIIRPALGPRARVTLAPEGWPMVPGRYGHLEWRGVEAGAGPARRDRRVYAFTGRARMIAKLYALRGVHRWQMGDAEAGVWIAADAVEGLRGAARLLQTRIRRPSSPGNPAALLRARSQQPRPMPRTG
jgi:hypothetical protein